MKLTAFPQTEARQTFRNLKNTSILEFSTFYLLNASAVAIVEEAGGKGLIESLVFFIPVTFISPSIAKSSLSHFQLIHSVNT